MHLWITVGLVGLVGCIAAATQGQLIQRASFDLGCSAQGLAISQIDDRSFGVLGCGKRAVYVESCDGPRNNLSTKCTWVLNGTIVPDAPAPSAPPPAPSPRD